MGLSVTVQCQVKHLIHSNFGQAFESSAAIWTSHAEVIALRLIHNTSEEQAFFINFITIFVLTRFFVVVSYDSMSHRERVEQFNEKLGKLTELNDIPRVSAAGNG